MVSQGNTSPLSGLATLISGGQNRMHIDRTYKPAVLRNLVTGKREEIILIDTQDEDIETSLLAIPSNPELKADLRAALSGFSPLEKRILFRVLVQGQSVREATTRMQRSARSWERWLSEKALPTLRIYLEDYREEATRRSSYVAPVVVEDEAGPVVEATLKCRFCPHVAVAKTEVAALKLLRSHCATEHNEQAKRIKAHVSEHDDGIRRDQARLNETRPVRSKNITGRQAI